MAEHLEAAERDLRSPRGAGAVRDHVAAVKRIEEASDAAYCDAIAALFDGRTDAVEVIKWKEVYDRLEDAADECMRAANVVESVTLKHS